MKSFLIFKELKFFKTQSSFKVKTYFLSYLLIRYILKLFGKKNLDILLKKIFYKEVISKINGIYFVHRVHEIFYQLPNLLEICYGWPNKIIAKSEDDLTVIDVGSHVGSFLLFINKNKKIKKGVCIEADLHNFNTLKKNMKINKVPQDKIILINKALWSERTKLNFFLDREGSGAHSLIKKGDKKIVVVTDTLDRVIKRHKINQIDLIKIDVEGAEAAVLNGAKKTLKKFHPRIIFEAWDDNYLSKVKKVLVPLNYKIKKIANENYLAY